MCNHKFILADEGNLIEGRHFYLYNCVLCGRYDIGKETNFSQEEKEKTIELIMK